MVYRRPKVRRPKSRIKQLADQRGIKYSYLAKRAGIHPSYFTRVESGEFAPPPGYFDNVAAALGVPVEWVQPQPEAVA